MRINWDTALNHVSSWLAYEKAEKASVVVGPLQLALGKRFMTLLQTQLADSS